MESQIEELLDKYWKGETSVAEEQYIKQHFKTNPMLSKESDYFRLLKTRQEVSFQPKKPKKTKRTIQKWLPVAATMTVGVFIAMLALREPHTDPFAIEDPKQALKVTKKTLMMLSTRLNEGQSYAMEITKINKAKDKPEISEEIQSQSKNKANAK